MPLPANFWDNHDVDPAAGWAHHGEHYVRDTPYCQLIATATHGAGLSYMPLVRFPVEIPGLTNEGDLWLPGSHDNPAKAMDQLTTWFDEKSATDEGFPGFIEPYFAGRPSGET